MKRPAALGAATVLLAAGLVALPATAQAAENTCPLGGLGQFLHLPGCEEDADDPAPSPTPTDGELLPGVPLPDPGEVLPVAPDPAAPGPGDPEAPAPGETAPPEDAPAAEPDPAAPMFTSDPPILSGSGLGLEGLSDIRIVEVRRADGSMARALRLTAEKVVVDGFALDVPSGHGGLANTSDRMTATGHVVVYADSISGILSSNVEIVIDTLRQPPSADTLRELTRLHIPLLGMTADQVVHTASHQQIHE